MAVRLGGGWGQKAKPKERRKEAGGLEGSTRGVRGKSSITDQHKVGKRWKKNSVSRKSFLVAFGSRCEAPFFFVFPGSTRSNYRVMHGLLHASPNRPTPRHA
jgi:hypothetical protein